MLSHKNKTIRGLVPVQGDAFAKPAAVEAARSGAISGGCMGPRLGAGRKMGRGATAAESRDGPFSVKRSEQDRRQGTRVGSGAFPVRIAEARLWRTLRTARIGYPCARCWRARLARPLRTAHREGGSVPSDGGRHVLLRAWRRHVPEARSGRPHYGQRFHSRAYGDFGGSG